MYRLITIAVLISMSLPAFASRTVVTQRPYYNPYYGAYYGGDYRPGSRFVSRNHSRFYDISDLEKYALNRNFTRENDRSRIERLEMQAFGAVQQGDLGTRYDNVRNAILSRPKQNYKTTLLRNISDYFNGQLTGYTPSLNSNDYYDSYTYGKNSTGNFSTPFGSRYENDRYGINSGASVRILD